jgi:hypothetical protein
MKVHYSDGGGMVDYSADEKWMMLLADYVGWLKYKISMSRGSDATAFRVCLLRMNDKIDKGELPKLLNNQMFMRR